MSTEPAATPTIANDPTIAVPATADNAPQAPAKAPPPPANQWKLADRIGRAAARAERKRQADQRKAAKRRNRRGKA